MATLARAPRRRALVCALLAVVIASVAHVPLRSEARQGPAQALPNLETFELPSELVDTAATGGTLEDGRTVPKVHVLLPNGYDDHPYRRYPVLWLLHGANGGTDTWIPGVAELLAGVQAIVVMPDGGVFGMYTDWWNGGARAGPAWATYHLELLRETIHERYRIRPDRRWHAIGGISMGGQGALRYAAMLPGYFGSVAAFSAALPDMQSLQAHGAISLLSAVGATYGASYEAIWGPPGGEYAEGNSPQQLASNLGNTRVYLTSGVGVPCQQDPINPGSLALDIVTEAALHAQQAPFADSVREAGGDVTSVSRCGVHTFGVWDRAFPEAREWGFFGDVPRNPDRWVYRTIATSGEMWGLRFRFTAPPAEVATFERSGGVLTGFGAGVVEVSGQLGCELRVALPFSQTLPPACFGPA